MTRWIAIAGALTLGTLGLAGAARGGTCTEATSVSAGEVDAFEATAEDWSHGTRVVDGGDAGVGDDYLQATATGAMTSGGKLVLVNLCQWTDDYTALGPAVTIGMVVRNEGATPLTLRLAVGDTLASNPPPMASDWYVTSDAAAVSLPANNVWTAVTFTLDATDMVCSIETSPCTDPLSTVLAGVVELRLLHSTTASHGPSADFVAATLGVDDVHVESVPVELQGFSIE